MLGGKKPPKRNKGKARVINIFFLEIITYNSQSYTLRRSITGGPILHKRWRSDGNGATEEYLEKLSDNEKKHIDLSSDIM